MPDWMQHNLESKLLGENSNNLRYTDDKTHIAESEEGLKSLLMKVKQESEKAGLNSTFKNEDHGFWSHDFMASRWGNKGNSERIYFLGSKITVDGGYSIELKDTGFLEEKLRPT